MNGGPSDPPGEAAQIHEQLSFDTNCKPQGYLFQAALRKNYTRRRKMQAEDVCQNQSGKVPELVDFSK
jgi:hypothetical protein